MTKKRTTVAAAVVATLLLAAAAGLSSALIHPAAPTSAYDVALGTVNLDGGSESVTVDSAAFVGGGGSETSASGTVVNKMAHCITDMTISIKKKGSTGGDPTASQVNCGGKTASAASVPGGSAGTVDGLNICGNQSASFGVTGINAQSTSEMTVNCTPSYLVDVGQVERAANSVDGWEFSRTSDSMRHGLLEMVHDTVIGDVLNVDEGASVRQLDGVVTFPPGSSATISAIYLLDVDDDYEEVSGATSSINGDDFQLANFSELDHTGHYLLVVVLSEALNHEKLLIDLTADF